MEDRLDVSMDETVIFLVLYTVANDLRLSVAI
jgi:hypothetical protein